MDGVSGVSAVVAIAQVGFSLAQTLNTYVADVRNGRGDIANLANEIDATATHIEELDKLIQENNTTNGWNSNGLKIAKKCSTDFEETLNQLRAVFSRSGATLSNKRVTRDDIDNSAFNRLTWPSQKTRLQSLRQDLYRVKIDILLFLNIYKAHVGTPQSEKDAATERVAALWRSKLEAQRQLVSLENPPRTRGIMNPTSSQRNQFSTQKRARFADTSPSRSRSRSRERESRAREPSRHGQHRRSRSLSSSGDESASRPTLSPQAGPETQRHPRQKAAGVNLDISNPGLDNMPGNSGHSSSSSSSNHDTKKEGSNPMNSRALVGAEVKYPEAESLGALFLKSMMGSGETISNKFSGKELLIQAISHPREAGMLLNVVSKMQSKPLNRKDSPEVILHDPTIQGGIATTRALSLVRTNGTNFQPFEIDYPVSLLAKRLYREQKMHRKGGPFGLQAWVNFNEIPLWCQQYIKDFLAHGSDENHFWSLLIVEPIYKESKSWTSRFRSKYHRNSDELSNILVVFKHCKKLREKPSQGAKDEMIDALAGRLAEPLSDLAKVMWERARYGPRKRERSPRPSQSRSRSRSRLHNPDIGYGSASVDNHNRPFATSGASNIYNSAPHDPYQNPNGNQPANSPQAADAYDSANAHNSSNAYQPPTSYQNANPYQSTYDQNQTYSYQPGNSYQPTIPAYGERESQRLVEVDIDEDEIDANIPDDQLTREVMARYTGAWQMDENGVAHEEDDQIRSKANQAQPTSSVEAVDNYMDIV